MVSRFVSWEVFCLIPYTLAGGVAQEQIVCQKMLKFVNISTTHLGLEDEQHATEAPFGRGAIASKEPAKKKA